MDEQQKVAMVTGAAHGIGWAIARALCQQGYPLFLIDIDRTMLETRVHELQEQGGQIGCAEGDLAREDEIERMVRQAEEWGGRVDILINNAGIARDSLTIRMKLKDWQDVLDVNVTAAFLLSRAIVRGMMKRRWGRIINISSVVAFTGNPGQTNYAASKAALIGLSRSLARETVSRNITVNAIAPGYVETAMTEKLDPQLKENFRAMIPLKRYGQPDDIAQTVLFLASEEASYITGQVLHVNGGLFM